MADTLRTLSALQALLADNTTGDISAQDLRDLLVSVYPTGRVLLASQSASNSAALNFTSRNAPFQSGDVFQSDFDTYEIELVHLLPATNAVSLELQYTADNSTFVNTNYVCTFHYAGSGAGHGAGSSVSTTFWYLSDLVKNTTADGGVSGELTLYDPLSTTQYKHGRGHVVNLSSTDGQLYQLMLGHRLTSTSAMLGFRLIMSSGNITSGIARVYGIPK